MKKQEKMHPQNLLKVFIFFLAFFISYPSAEAHSPLQSSIQEKILTARPGDYAVLSRGSQKFFFLIRQSSSEATWVEMSEFASLTQQEKKLVEQSSWKNAFHQLQSSKKVYLLRISKNPLMIFVLKNAQWMPLSEKDPLPFFVKILRLPLSPAPSHLIKYKGKERTPWSPRTSLNGEPITLPSSAWISVWPKDSSPLSEKNILIYFSNNERLAFPLWTSIDTPTGTVIIKTIEMGHQAASSYPALPNF